MARRIFIVVLMTYAMTLQGQNISVTFTGTGAATIIDSVKATNLRTYQSVTLPGNETLTLAVNTSVPVTSLLNTAGRVYPNPFQGSTTLTTFVENPQRATIKVINQLGQVVAQTDADLQIGETDFSLGVKAAGVYFVNIRLDKGAVSQKVICTEPSGTENHIWYSETVSGSLQTPIEFKSLATGYSLGYRLGDVILYRCLSGIYTTIVTDSPVSSKNYNVEFAACTDPDGKNYSVVKIGTQTWMAENLAYLPAVSPSNFGSDDDPYCYVYDYEGSNVSAAKANTSYINYGVLYNCLAAKTACPSGWHLPTDTEWKSLETNLGMSQSDADMYGWRKSGDVEGDLLSFYGMANGRNGGSRSGFNAVAGGIRYFYGFFALKGEDCRFWSSTDNEINESTTCIRGLSYNLTRDGVWRGVNTRDEGFSVRCLKNN